MWGRLWVGVVSGCGGGGGGSMRRTARVEVGCEPLFGCAGACVAGRADGEVEGEGTGVWRGTMLWNPSVAEFLSFIWACGAC